MNLTVLAGICRPLQVEILWNFFKIESKCSASVCPPCVRYLWKWKGDLHHVYFSSWRGAWKEELCSHVDWNQNFVIQRHQTEERTWPIFTIQSWCQSCCNTQYTKWKDCSLVVSCQYTKQSRHRLLSECSLSFIAQNNNGELGLSDTTQDLLPLSLVWGDLSKMRHWFKSTKIHSSKWLCICLTSWCGNWTEGTQFSVQLST